MVLRKNYFESLDVWKKSMDFNELIFKTTQDFPSQYQFNLSSQLNRTSLSVSNNIAEGVSRLSFKEQARFITIAYGSLMECMNMIILCQRLNLISLDISMSFRKIIGEISNKLNALRKTQIKRSKSK